MTPFTHVTSALLASLAVAAIAVALLPEQGDPALDGVQRYEAPRYGKVLWKNDDGYPFLRGTVVVEVQVAGDGTVTSASVVSNPKILLLTPWAEEAAKLWLFEPSPVAQSRTRRIPFVFEGVVESESDSGVVTSYENPLTLHVVLAEPTILRLQRTDGLLPHARCEVHGVPMIVERLPIQYGLWSYTTDQAQALNKYWKARKRNFPNAHQFVRLGDIVGSEVEAEVYICSSCLRAREDWIARHPKDQVEPD
jgi:TonB family protein